jgi:hypothetical protein
LTLLQLAVLALVLSLDGSNNGQHVTVSVGNPVVVTLGTIGSWRFADPEISSPAVRLKSVVLMGPPNPGGPRYRYTFIAAAKGEAKVRLRVISDSPAVVNANTFTLWIRVRRP